MGNGTSLNAAVGYDFGALRVEGALSRVSVDIDSHTTDDGKVDVDGKASALGVMANGWFDIDTGSALSPFVGGGLGMVRVSAKADAGEDTLSDRAFAWQVGAGVSYGLGDGASAQLGWRYLDITEGDYDGNKWDPDGIHIVEVGMRFSF